MNSPSRSHRKPLQIYVPRRVQEAAEAAAAAAAAESVTQRERTSERSQKVKKRGQTDRRRVEKRSVKVVESDSSTTTYRQPLREMYGRHHHRPSEVSNAQQKYADIRYTSAPNTAPNTPDTHRKSSLPINQRRRSPPPPAAPIAPLLSQYDGAAAYQRPVSTDNRAHSVCKTESRSPASPEFGRGFNRRRSPNDSPLSSPQRRQREQQAEHRQRQRQVEPLLEMNVSPPARYRPHRSPNTHAFDNDYRQASARGHGHKLLVSLERREKPPSCRRGDAPVTAAIHQPAPALSPEPETTAKVVELTAMDYSKLERWDSVESEAEVVEISPETPGSILFS